MTCLKIAFIVSLAWLMQCQSVPADHIEPSKLKPKYYFSENRTTTTDGKVVQILQVHGVLLSDGKHHIELNSVPNLINKKMINTQNQQQSEDSQLFGVEESDLPLTFTLNETVVLTTGCTRETTTAVILQLKGYGRSPKEMSNNSF